VRKVTLQIVSGQQATVEINETNMTQFVDMTLASV
jgi:hypothetical protein